MMSILFALVVKHRKRHIPDDKHEMSIPESVLHINETAGHSVTKDLGKMKIRAGVKSREEVLSRVTLDIDEGKRNYAPLKSALERLEPEFQLVKEYHMRFLEDWKEKIATIEWDDFKCDEFWESVDKTVHTRAPENLRRQAVTPNKLIERYERLLYSINDTRLSCESDSDLYDFMSYIYLYNNLTYTRQKAIDWQEIFRKKAQQSDKYTDPWIYFLGERYEFSTKENDYQFNFNISFLRHVIAKGEPLIYVRRQARGDQEMGSCQNTNFEISHGRVKEISKDKRFMYFEDNESKNTATVKLYCGPNSYLRSVDQINESHVFARFETQLACTKKYMSWYDRLSEDEFAEELPWLLY